MNSVSTKRLRKGIEGRMRKKFFSRANVEGSGSLSFDGELFVWSRDMALLAGKRLTLR